MQKILNILNSKYFLATVIGLSVLVIVIGVLMVKHANEQALIYSQQQSEQNVDDQSAEKLVEQLQQLAASAEAELAASKSDGSKPPASMDFIPDESRKKVDQMLDKNPDIGSEDWCEVLMVKPGKDWTESEQENFAKYCLD